VPLTCVVDGHGLTFFSAAFLAVSKSENVSIVTLDSTRPAQFALECRKNLKSYFFYVADKPLSALPFNTKVVATMRVSNEEPSVLLATSVGEERIVIGATSWSVLSPSVFGYDKETAIGFSVGSYQWLFSSKDFMALPMRLGRSAASLLIRSLIEDSSGQPFQGDGCCVFRMA
jgi:hypothetical protein